MKEQEFKMIKKEYNDKKEQLEKAKLYLGVLNIYKQDIYNSEQKNVEIEQELNNWLASFNVVSDKTYLYYGMNSDYICKYRHLLSRKVVFFNKNDQAHDDFINNSNILYFTQSIKNPDIREQDFEEIRTNYILYILSKQNYEDINNFDTLKTSLSSGQIRVRKAINKDIN